VLERLLQDCPPGLDGAICVSRSLLPLVSPHFPPGRTWYVPHGIDTSYFAPGAAAAGGAPVFLCVGSHCRDLDTLRRAADVIHQMLPEAVVRLIATRSQLPADLRLGRVEHLEGLSDLELLQQYQQASVVLLPLAAATANNSLLEAMACGKAIVVTDTGGVRDYVDGASCVSCPPGDAHAHAVAAVQLFHDAARRASLGAAARARAEEVTWPIVRTQVRAIMDGL
jgi:glycosyltransferase involved in cell wall biosynthesis